MSNEFLQKKLEVLRSVCAIKDPEYWDLSLQESEELVGESVKADISIRTKDDYTITLKFMPMGWINGYIRLAPAVHLASWIKTQPHYSYDEMNYECNLPVELTYFELSDMTFGWDHAHGWDANLFIPMSSQPDKTVSGFVQVLDEARKVVEEFRAKESSIKMELKQQQTETIREELMKTACHPKRIAAWLAQGFDPFEQVN